MKDTLKDFFKKHKEPLIQAVEDTIKEYTEEVDEKTYEEWGFEQAQKQNGNLLSFKGSMNLVKEHFKNKEFENHQKKQDNITNAKKELDTLEHDIQGKEASKEFLNEKIQNLKNKIEELKKDIIRIRENPQEVLKDKTSSVGFIFGLVILSFLTIYLFIFYSSASYAGFFKNFADGDNVTSSIFDPQALVKAYEEGTTELILILTIPFIFLGLGYLIHKFQEGKGVVKYFKIGMMILITFAFDALLAYKIEKGLYEVERLMDPTGTMPPHKLSMALDSENFWLVIFAGFIVYIIWGFLFDFVMEAYDKLDIIKQAIKARETEIKIYQDDIQKTEDDIQKTEEEIIELKKKTLGFQSVMSGNTIIIDWTEFGKTLLEFTSGWASWMTANKKSKEEIDTIWKAQETFIEQHQKEEKK